MGRTSKPLVWLVDPEYTVALEDLISQGHTVLNYADGMDPQPDVILSKKAWYCPNVEFLTKYRDIIVKQARLRKYGKDVG